MKKRTNAVRIMAVIGIILLAGMYIASLVLALINNSTADKLLRLSIFATFIVPFMIYIFMMFYRLSHRKAEPEEMIFADEKDDPFTDEDFNEND